MSSENVIVPGLCGARTKMRKKRRGKRKKARLCGAREKERYKNNGKQSLNRKIICHSYLLSN